MKYVITFVSGTILILCAVAAVGLVKITNTPNPGVGMIISDSGVYAKKPLIQNFTKGEHITVLVNGEVYYDFPGE